MEKSDMTTKEAGKLLDVADAYIRQLILAGKLPARKFAGVWVIDRKDFTAFKKRREKERAERGPKHAETTETAGEIGHQTNGAQP